MEYHHVIISVTYYPQHKSLIINSAIIYMFDAKEKLLHETSSCIDLMEQLLGGVDEFQLLL